MGCWAGFKNDNFIDKEIIVNLGIKDIENYLEKNEEYQKNHQTYNLVNLLLSPWKQMQKAQ